MGAVYDFGMYGWWQSFEHFSFPGSSPMATSEELDRVEKHAREHWSIPAKRPVIGSWQDSDWIVEYRVDPNQLHRQSHSQRSKYDRARRGGSRGNLGPIPTQSELFLQTTDLDAGDVSHSSTLRRSAESSRLESELDPAIPVLVEVDNNVVERFEVTTHWSATERDRREAELQERYRNHLEQRGHTVMTYQIPTPSGAVLATDLYDVTADDLIEVKSSIDRETLRLALGQILDYERFIRPKLCTLLVPERPAQEMVDLFSTLAIRVAWPHDDGFEMS